jgi:hypothetical protein
MSEAHEGATNEVARLMAEVTEMMAPIEETARGFRESLKRDHDWNDAAAQIMAAEQFRIMARIVTQAF